jgi:hypothetical protein
MTLRSLRSARDRLLHFLRRRLDTSGNTVALPMSLKELALALGISPPDQHQHFYAQLPYGLVGSVDTSGNPWASILLGSTGFLATRAIAPCAFKRARCQVIP